jgi:hypothetical protein
MSHSAGRLARCLVEVLLCIAILRAGYVGIVWLRFPHTGKVPAHFVPFADLSPESLSWLRVGLAGSNTSPFVAPLNGLSCLAVQLAGSGGIGKSLSVAWDLEELDSGSQIPVRSGVFSARWRDPEILDATFNPIPASANKRYRLTLRPGSPDGTFLLPVYHPVDREAALPGPATSTRFPAEATTVPQQAAEGSAWAVDLKVGAGQLDGVAIGGAELLRGMRLRWSLSRSGAGHSTATSGELNEMDTRAGAEIKILFAPIPASQGEVFRLALQSDRASQASPRIAGVYFRDPQADEPAKMMLGGACYEAGDGGQ